VYRARAGTIETVIRARGRDTTRCKLSRYEKLSVVSGCTIEKNDIRYVSTECSRERSGIWYPRKSFDVSRAYERTPGKRESDHLV